MLSAVIAAYALHSADRPTQLAYVKNHVLHVVAVDASGRLIKGASAITICRIPRDPEGSDDHIYWTPSGEIVFDPWEEASIDIVAARAGARPRPVASGTNTTFTPDGRQMAYVVWRSITPTFGTWDMWTYVLPTGQRRRLLENCRNIAWSADGKQVAFAIWDRKRQTEPITVAEWPSLKRLRTIEAFNPVDLSFSPNGRILAVHFHLSRPLTGHTLFDLRSGKPIELSFPEKYAPPTLEDWSPDGSSAIFDWRIQSPTNDGIWTRQSEAVTQVSSGKSVVIGEGDNARFSPNGAAVLYQTGSFGHKGDLWRTELGGAKRRDLLVRGITQFALRRK